MLSLKKILINRRKGYSCFPQSQKEFIFTSVSAFSLIEMLTVMFVLAILASLALSMMGRIQMKAKSLKCKSNQKQMAILLLLYNVDNKGYMPNWKTDEIFQRKALQTRYWHGHLSPYIFKVQDNNWNMNSWKDKDLQRMKAGDKGYGSLELFVCPSAAAEGRVWKPGNGISTSYLAIDTFFGVSLKAGRTHSVRLADVQRSHEKILISEGMGPRGKNIPIIKSLHGFRLGGYFKGSWAIHSWLPANLHDTQESFWYKAVRFASNAEKNRLIKEFYQSHTKSYAKEMAHVGFDSKRMYFVSYVPPLEDGYNYFGINYNFMTGSQNVMFADMHVSKKSCFWLNDNSETFRTIR